MGIRGGDALRGGALNVRDIRADDSAGGVPSRRGPSPAGPLREVFGIARGLTAGARKFRARWEDLCASVQFAGRWVALDKVVYEAGTREPAEVEVVDVDDDLASLCARMLAANQTACCVLHCHAKVHAKPRAAAALLDVPMDPSARDSRPPPSRRSV